MSILTFNPFVPVVFLLTYLLLLLSEDLFTLHQSVPHNQSRMWCSTSLRYRTRVTWRSNVWIEVLSGMIFLPAQKLSSIVQCEHNLRWMTWYQPSLSCFRFYLLSGITVYIPYNLTVCLFQMLMNAPRQPSVTSSMATVPIPLAPIFVPAKLVSLEMVGPVLVRWIQIRFCKNNHISRMHLTWIEKH